MHRRSRGRAARVVVLRDVLPAGLIEVRRVAAPRRCGLNAPGVTPLSRTPSSRTPSHAPRRRPAAGPARRPRPASSSRAERSAAQSADRELAVWFEKSAAESPLPTETSFSALGLPQQLVTALERRGIRTAFPIQAATLADCLTGRDVIGRAQTGSGKTLAFCLPMLTL